MLLGKRFSGADWYFDKNREEVFIGGAGGIGSYLSMFINRAGFDITLYDRDTVEEENLDCQLFKYNDLGKTKAQAVRDSILEYNDELIFAKYDDIINQHKPYKYVFACLDNIEGRIIMFNNWVKEYKNDNEAIFIDGRLLLEYYQIICVTNDKIDEYRRKYTFKKTEIEDVPCTLKQTSHFASMIASMMTSYFTNHIVNVQEKQKIRLVPFYTDYHGPTATRNTIIK